MSRVGRKPIPIPKGVELTAKGQRVEVTGPKGELSIDLPPGVNVRVEEGQILVGAEGDGKRVRAFHGLGRALIANMVTGVTEGFRKTLEVVGTGYRVEVKAQTLVLNVGYSHPVEFQIPEGIQITAEKPTRIVVDGIDRYLVGQAAAEIRRVRRVEPYKGKGIRYSDEQIRRKQGKTFAGGE